MIWASRRISASLQGVYEDGSFIGVNYSMDFPPSSTGWSSVVPFGSLDAIVVWNLLMLSSE